MKFSARVAILEMFLLLVLSSVTADDDDGDDGELVARRREDGNRTEGGSVTTRTLNSSCDRNEEVKSKLTNVIRISAYGEHRGAVKVSGTSKEISIDRQFQGLGSLPALFGGPAPTASQQQSPAPAANSVFSGPALFGGPSPDATPPPIAVRRPTRRRRCHLRTCDQTITGRMVSYARALQVVQSEEYLDAADLSVIRRRRKRSPQAGSGEDFAVRSKQADGSVSGRRLILQERHRNHHQITTTTTTTAAPPPSPSPEPQSQTVQGLVTAALIATLAAVVSSSSANSNNGGTPVAGVPLPGQPGGGDSPTAASDPAAAAEALSLVPPGLVPVAIFPPYASPRTRDAVSAIFRELPAVRRRHERSPGASKFSSTWRAILDGARRRARKLRLKFSSWKSRLFGRRSKNKRKRPPGAIFEEDLFGFRVRVRLVEGQPCELGVTCDERGNKIDVVGSGEKDDENDDEDVEGSGFFSDRQTGEEFSSDGPPECRVETNPDGCIR